MPRVPTFQSNVSPQRGPVVFRDARGAQGAFGAQASVGTALKNISGTLDDASNFLANEQIRRQQLLAQAQQDMIESQEAIERVRSHGQGVEMLNETLRTFQTAAEPFADPRALDSYFQKLDQVVEQTVSRHRGGPQSKAMLTELMLEQRFKFRDEGIKAARTGQNVELSNQLQGILNNLVTDVASNPSSFDQVADQWQRAIGIFGNALSVEDQDARLAAGLETIAQASFDANFAAGQMDAAQAIVDSGSMSAPAARTARNQLLKHQNTAANEVLELEAAIQAREFILGRSLTNAERAKVLDLQGQGKTFGQVVEEIEGELGRELTEQEKLRKATIQGGDEPFGRGDARNIVDSLGLRFARGETDEAEDVRMLLALGELVGVDPQSGLQRQFGPFERFILRQRGFDPEQFNRESQEKIIERSLQGRTSPTPQQNIQAAVPPRQNIQAAIPPQESTQAPPEPTRPDPTQAVLGPDSPPLTPEDVQRTIEEAKAVDPKVGFLAPGVPFYRFWEIADYVQGIAPAVGRTANETAVIGDVTGDFGSLETTLDDYLDTMIFMMTEALRTNQIPGQREKENIINLLNGLKGKTAGSPGGMRDAIKGIDAALATSGVFDEQILESPDLNVKDRSALVRQMEQMRKFRRILAAPRIVRSEKEVEEMLESGDLGPGDRIQTPDGRIIRIQ